MSKIQVIQQLWTFRVRVTAGCMIILFVLLNTGCHKEESAPTGNTYLVEYSPVNLFTVSSIEGLLSPLETEYPEASGIKDHAEFSVQILKITYKTHFKGEEINASGLVCLPVSSGNFPIVSFQNGTITKHNDAPTSTPLNFNYMLLEFMASNGYILLIPDNIGFGVSSDQVHPYYQKESTCNAIIDMLHACNELVNDKNILAKGNGTYYLLGYSQGGWATLSVLEQLEKSGQTDISVSAASCGAGAYDLNAMANYVLGLNTFPGPVYLPYFIYSEQVFGALTDPLEKFFNPPYAEKIPELFNGDYSNSEVDASLNDTISRLLTADMIANFSTGAQFGTLRNLLSENSVSAWAANSRIRFYHGTDDMNVPPQQSQTIYDNFIAAGSPVSRVEHVDLPGLTHETGIIPWGISTINWFNELEGK